MYPAVLRYSLFFSLYEQPPDWIVRLCNSHLVERVPKFSKFLHGCATVLEDRVETSPYWIANMSKVGLTL